MPTRFISVQNKCDSNMDFLVTVTVQRRISVPGVLMWDPALTVSRGLLVSELLLRSESRTSHHPNMGWCHFYVRVPLLSTQLIFASRHVSPLQTTSEQRFFHFPSDMFHEVNT